MKCRKTAPMRDVWQIQSQASITEEGDDNGVYKNTVPQSLNWSTSRPTVLQRYYRKKNSDSRKLSPKTNKIEVRLFVPIRATQVSRLS